MRIVVAGGAGFLGSHLVDRLLERGDHVVVLDNLYTGSVDNFKHHQKNIKFKFILHDVTEPIHIEADQVFNFACPASPIHYQKNPVETIRTSILGSLNMLQVAKENGSRIFQASTSEVYGDPTISPQDESYLGNVNPIGIRACYDEGKRASETIFFDFHRQHKLDIKVARIFNTYGPRMDLQDGRVVSNFVVQALTNSPITIYGDGNQTRSFCYVDDLIEGILVLMNKDSSITGPVNLGNPKEHTMIELANLIRDLTNSNSKIIHEVLPQDDPKQRKPDVSLAKSILDWSPKVGLEEGLKKTIDEFKSRLNEL